MQKPRCPKCGDPVMKRGGTRGTQRWGHNHRSHACKWQGTQPVGLPEAKAAGINRRVSKALHRKIRKARGVQRYVITAAQNATPVNKPFLDSLLRYCDHNKAQLVVIPYRYKNPTSVWTPQQESDDWWAPELQTHLMRERTQVGKHVVILADVMTQPTASTPLQGYETLVGGKSGIIGHPKLELVTVPAPQNKLPTILTTTGAVTIKNYIPAKAGKKAEHHHTFGACVLEIDGDAYHIRQLNAVKDGSFMDLDHEYTPAGAHKHDGVAAIVMGDSHVEFIDPQVVEATFGKGGLVDFLKPKYLVWHDLHDFYSRNHHHVGDAFTNFAKHQAGVDDVEKMLDETWAFVDKHTRTGTLNVFVESNHPDALGRWLKSADWKSDPRNAKFILRTQLAMVEAAEMSPSGAATLDPFVYWGLRKLKRADHARFLGRDESFSIERIECGYHGHKGVNGARGSIKGYSRIGVKTVIAHGHSPGIREGAYQVGTNSRLRLGYNSGPSSWLHTDCLIYTNGKRCLVNIINGKTRAK